MLIILDEIVQNDDAELNLSLCDEIKKSADFNMDKII